MKMSFNEIELIEEQKNVVDALKAILKENNILFYYEYEGDAYAAHDMACFILEQSNIDYMSGEYDHAFFVEVNGFHLDFEYEIEAIEFKDANSEDFKMHSSTEEESRLVKSSLPVVDSSSTKHIDDVFNPLFWLQTLDSWADAASSNPSGTVEIHHENLKIVADKIRQTLNGYLK